MTDATMPQARSDSDQHASDLSQVIAIDGPVASGKTVVGRELAKRLGWAMLDTGIMYRALTWYAQERRVDLSDHVRLTEIANAVKIEVGLPPSGSIETASIALDGDDATPHLREPAVEAAVSTVAAVPGVREAMVAAQRKQAQHGRLVMVGRDIGTVVCPDAEVKLFVTAPIKVFLTASAEVRAHRRAEEMRQQGREISDADVQDEIVRRDGRDANRDASPLRPADGSVELNTTKLSREEVVQTVLDLVRENAPELLS